MDGSDGNSNSQRVTRDPEYYFTNVVFQVSTTGSLPISEEVLNCLLVGRK